MSPLNETEQATLARFVSEHVCRKAPWWRRQPRRAVRAVEGPPNGIAPSFDAVCACGERADISDYSTW